MKVFDPPPPPATGGADVSGLPLGARLEGTPPPFAVGVPPGAVDPPGVLPERELVGLGVLPLLEEDAPALLVVPGAGELPSLVCAEPVPLAESDAATAVL